jgi:hypothetical protein
MIRARSRWLSADQYRDEDDVVDAEHGLEHRQRQQCNPGARVDKQVQHHRPLP